MCGSPQISNSLTICFAIGATLAILVVVFSMVTLILDFRSQVMSQSGCVSLWSFVLTMCVRVCDAAGHGGSCRAIQL